MDSIWCTNMKKNLHHLKKSVCLHDNYILFFFSIDKLVNFDLLRNKKHKRSLSGSEITCVLFEFIRDFNDAFNEFT